MKILQYNKFFTWWVSILLLATSVFWAGYYGIISAIWESDVTKITLLISVIFVISNSFLGYFAYKIGNTGYVSKNKESLKEKMNTFWFISEQLMALGMLGTVIGLIHMLSANFISSDMQNGAAMQGLLANMWKSMGLALYTNAVGLIASIVLKVQVYIIGYELDET